MKLLLIRRKVLTVLACALAAALIFLAVSAPSIAAARSVPQAEEATQPLLSTPAAVPFISALLTTAVPFFKSLYVGRPTEYRGFHLLRIFPAKKRGGSDTTIRAASLSVYVASF